MSMLGVITARGGSKRLPNKNIKELGGKPLIAWSIEVGLATCDKLVVSTDSPAIAEVSIKHGAEVLMRPNSLSHDDTSSLAVVVHAMQSFPNFDNVLLLQPTSPFRTVADVREAVGLMDYVRADSIVSVVEFPNMAALFSLGHGSRMLPMAPGAVYTPNGAIYLTTMPHLMHGGDWYGVGAYGLVMPRERSIDIDTHADFDAAVAMLDDDGKFKAFTNKKITSQV
jgi:CMP-N,N'-diacetyllegionaminic acid synthase